MLRLKKVAITGGLSCGKTTVLKMFESLGAQIVDADKMVHQLLLPDTELGRQVIHLLGPEVVVDNQFDRAQIAKKVFARPEQLKSLERLIHPPLRKKILDLMDEEEKTGMHPMIAVEIPLLYEMESTLAPEFDATIAVVAGSEVTAHRFAEKTGFTEAHYQMRASRQLANEEKARRADYVIENNGTKEELYMKVKQVFNDINNKPTNNPL